MEQKGLAILTQKYKKNPDSVRISLNRLEDQIEKMKKAIELSFPDQLTEADYTFHQIVIEGNNNSLFAAIYQTLKAFMAEEINRTHDELEDQSHIVHEHQLILDAIKSGNVSKAKKAFEAHMESKCFQIFNAKAKAPVTE
jgi:DNA-binding GntR family transcriptional regulator